MWDEGERNPFRPNQTSVMHKVSILAGTMGMAAFLSFAPLRSQQLHAGVLGNWYDEDGNSISLPQAIWNATTPEGSVTISYSGVTFTGLVGHVAFDAGPISFVPTGSSFSWRNPFNWDSWIIPVVWFENSFMSLKNGDLVNWGESNGVTFAPLDAIDAFVNGGPSETSVSVQLPLP